MERKSLLHRKKKRRLHDDTSQDVLRSGDVTKEAGTKTKDNTSSDSAAGLPPSSSSSSKRQQQHEFETNVLDHCETPKIAYEHLDAFLQLLATHMGKPKSRLCIWDPFYCNGSMKTMFEELGYTNVLHENKDFYRLIQDNNNNKIPTHDVLVTNPPYSDDHIPRLLQFCLATELPHGRPVCLLLPNWVSRQPDYAEKFVLPNSNHENELLYLGPVEPYTYTMPEWVTAMERPEHVGTNGKTTPYLSSWYLVVPHNSCNNNSSNDSSKTSFLEQMDAMAKKKKKEWVVAKTVKGLKWKINKLVGKKTKTKKKKKHGSNKQKKG